MSKLLKRMSVVMALGCMVMLSAPSWSKSEDGEDIVIRQTMVWGDDVDVEGGRSMFSMDRVGPFSMGGGNFIGLKLTSEQRTKLAEIRREMRRKQWDMMEKLIFEREKLHELYEADTLDVDALDRQHAKFDALRRDLIRMSNEGRNRIEAELTKEQLERVRRWRRGYNMMNWRL